MVNGVKGSRKVKKNKSREYVCQLQEEDHFECEGERFPWNEIFCMQIEMVRLKEMTLNEL